MYLLPYKVFLRKVFPFVFFACLFTGCHKGQTLRIGGQDLIAFGAQKACNFKRNDLGIRISWKDATPVNFIIHNSVPAEYDSALYKAAEAWNQSSGKSLVNLYRNSSFDNPPGKDKTNVIYWMTDWDPAAVSEQARTITKSDLSRIIDADIKINAKNFRFYLTDGVTTFAMKSGRIHLESLMVHEFGHALGMGHIDQTNYVMYPYLKSSIERVLPSEEELSELGCEY